MSERTVKVILRMIQVVLIGIACFFLFTMNGLEMGSMVMVAACLFLLFCTSMRIRAEQPVLS